MRGISSLAKETTKLEVGRDATGATCINQYVVVKTLGRGSFGKVKLCLNTLDGQLYAVKVRAALMCQAKGVAAGVLLGAETFSATHSWKRAKQQALVMCFGQGMGMLLAVPRRLPSSDIATVYQFKS